MLRCEAQKRDGAMARWSDGTLLKKIAPSPSPSRFLTTHRNIAPSPTYTCAYYFARVRGGLHATHDVPHARASIRTSGLRDIV